MPFLTRSPKDTMRKPARLITCLTLCLAVLSACDTRRQADAVAGYFWTAVQEEDLEMIEGLSTNASDWALDEAIAPLLGGQATLDTEAATREDDRLYVPTTLTRRSPLAGWQPVAFDTVLVRASDGYRVDLTGTLEAYQAGAKAAAARRYEEAAALLSESLAAAADGLVAQLETARTQLEEDLPEQAISLTRALRSQIDAALSEAGTSIEDLLAEIADQVEMLQRELESLTPPDTEGDATSEPQVPPGKSGEPPAPPAD
jgi:hypothetical protein